MYLSAAHHESGARKLCFRARQLKATFFAHSHLYFHAPSQVFYQREIFLRLSYFFFASQHFIKSVLHIRHHGASFAGEGKAAAVATERRYALPGTPL